MIDECQESPAWLCWPATQQVGPLPAPFEGSPHRLTSCDLIDELVAPFDPARSR